ncbi:MAG: hypothetical protein SRB2_02145 [Desulfobacteraceae bacterium Eth-SRB2]|nr:MAG: hypothetical protein SRB2_02145 [Desulfobacteraceae bacterium Eth-SRB2]
MKVNMQANFPKFRQTLNDMFEGDQDQIKFLQRVLGYSLLGENKERTLFIFYEPSGGNAKDLIANLVCYCLGSNSRSSRYKFICHHMWINYEFYHNML